MLKHIVMWNYAENFSDAENAANAQKIKHDLEALVALDGVIEMKVRINELPYSNTDIMLDSTFESEEALNAYKIHPAHVAAAEFITTALKNRTCFDWTSCE
ncbi:MAG: Dabb family protein [Defluviitaleaceae bacterium]|nr:Dabb family protein [Defluviitaleaceae bacterium]